MTFCGRETEIRDILDDCKADHFVVLSHEPGLGATSLLKAGLLPAMKAEGLIAVVWSDWQGSSFAGELKEGIAQAVREQADDGFFAEVERLDEMLERIHA